MSWLPTNSERPWFRLGNVAVTSSLLLVGLGLIGMVATALVPSLWLHLSFLPTFTVEPWQLVTWPIVNLISIWTVFSLFFLWYFGTEVENELGRVKTALLYVGIWASVTIAGLLAYAISGTVMVAGLALPGMILFLLFILDAPQRPFFGGIPAWGVGLVFLGLDVVQMLQYRQFSSILTLVLGAALSVVIARQLGYLRGLSFIPAMKQRTPAQKMWEQSAKNAKQRVADQQRMDTLLSKVSASGLDSLTSRERAELKKLSERLRAARG